MLLLATNFWSQCPSVLFHICQACAGVSKTRGPQLVAHHQPHSEEEQDRRVSPPFVPLAGDGLGWQLPLLVHSPGEGPEHSTANAWR